MKKVLANIKFKCDNDCGKDIDYSDLLEHYTKTCPKLDYKQKLINLMKKKDVYADKIKELNTILINIDSNLPFKDNTKEFDERIKTHPNFLKHKLNRNLGPFGIGGNRVLYNFPGNS